MAPMVDGGQHGLFDRPARLHILHSEVMPRLRSYPAPRVWLAEATGPEDVLALTVLLAEHRLLARTQVFVTAAEEAQLVRARRDTISASRLADCARAYRDVGGLCGPGEFISLHEGIAHLRAHGEFVWATHGLETDASFNEFDLIVCMRPLAECGPQHRVLRLFSGSLPLLGMLCVIPLSLGMHLPGFTGLAPAAGLYRRAI